jgi:Carboxypeptidase regulatory-like domain
MIRGTVVDSHGAGLPGVKVRADGAESRTATTTPDGRYELEFKRSGRVVVRASNGRAIFAPRTNGADVDVSFTWSGKTRPDGSFSFLYAPGKRIEDLEWSNVVLMSGKASKTGIDLEFSATARNGGDVGTARTCDQHAEMHLR